MNTRPSLDIVNLAKASLLPFPNPLDSHAPGTLPESVKAAKISTPQEIPLTSRETRQYLQNLDLHTLGEVSKTRVAEMVGIQVPPQPFELGRLIFQRALKSLGRRLGLDTPDSLQPEFRLIGRHMVAVFAELHCKNSTPTIDSAWNIISENYANIANQISQNPATQKIWIDHMLPPGITGSRDYFKHFFNLLGGLRIKQPSLFPPEQPKPSCTLNEARHILVKSLTPPYSQYDPSYARIGKLIAFHLIMRPLDPSLLSPDSSLDFGSTGRWYLYSLPKQLASYSENA